MVIQLTFESFKFLKSCDSVLKLSCSIKFTLILYREQQLVHLTKAKIVFQFYVLILKNWCYNYNILNIYLLLRLRIVFFCLQIKCIKLIFRKLL